MLIDTSYIDEAKARFLSRWERGDCVTMGFGFEPKKVKFQGTVVAVLENFDENAFDVLKVKVNGACAGALQKMEVFHVTVDYCKNGFIFTAVYGHIPEVLNG